MISSSTDSVTFMRTFYCSRDELKLPKGLRARDLRPNATDTVEEGKISLPAK
jgi:hypothetical protein